MKNKPKSIPVHRGKISFREELPTFDESQGTPVVNFKRGGVYSLKEIKKVDERIKVLEELAKEGYDGLTLDNVIVRLKAIRNYYDNN